MKKTKILLILLLITALVGALALVVKNQNIQRGATFANTTLSVLPSSKITQSVGDTLSIQVWFYTENNGALVDGVQAKLCYGNELSLDKNSGAIGNTGAGFSSEAIISDPIAVGTSQTCSVVVATSQKSSSNLSASAKAMTVNFSVVKAGSGSILIDKDGSAVTGENTASTTDKSLAITSVAGTTYEIGGTSTVITGEDPILNYKVAYANVKADNAACVVKWPMQIIALGEGESKVYTNVIPSNSTAVGNTLVFSGSLVLKDFNHFNKVAVFIKGPKHIQMKYGIQNQSAAYNKAGGELTLTNDSSTSPVYDFTAYPMIPGDVTGDSDGVQDGWINGIDFAFVKNKVVNEHVAPKDAGTYLQADLDGDCQYNTNDITILQISIQTKQGQLY